MDIDLGEGWEKKALIVVAVVVFILVAYAYNPFQPKPNITSANESYKPPSPARVNPLLLILTNLTILLKQAKIILFNIFG